MTVRRAQNGDLVVSRSFAALVPLAILVIGLAIGWGVSWGSMYQDVQALKVERSGYVQQGTFEATLKSISSSLGSIDGRLGRLERAQDAKG